MSQALATQLDGTAGELTPPRYGATQASFSGPLSGGQGPTWLRTLNLDPRYRAAASLGASLVRANQEALILSAWDQAGQVNRANLVLRQGQLARELGVSGYTRRVGAAGQAAPPMDDGRLLQLTSGVQGQIAGPAAADRAAGTTAAALGANAAVAAVLTVPFRRLAQPTGPVAARLAAAPLPAPVSNLARAGGIAPVPPLTPVTGLVDLTAISANPAAPETLQALTAARVSAPRFPWEPGGPTLQQAALNQAGSGTRQARRPTSSSSPATSATCGSSAARSAGLSTGTGTRWRAGPLRRPAGSSRPGRLSTPAPRIPTGTSRHASPAGRRPSSTGTRPTPRRIPPSPWPPPLWKCRRTVGDNGVRSNAYLVSVDCTLGGDLIPGVADSPVRQVTTDWGEPVWPAMNLTSFAVAAIPGGAADPLPPLTLAAAVSTGDLTGTGGPSIAAAWSVSAGTPERTRAAT